VISSAQDVLIPAKRKIIKETKHNTKTNTSGFVGVKTPRPAREENQTVQIKSHAHHHHVGFLATLQSRSFFLEQAPTTIARQGSETSEEEQFASASSSELSLGEHRSSLVDARTRDRSLGLGVLGLSQETEPVNWGQKERPRRRRYSEEITSLYTPASPLPALRRTASDSGGGALRSIGPSGPATSNHAVVLPPLSSPVRKPSKTAEGRPTQRKKVKGKSWGLTEYADAGKISASARRRGASQG